MIALAAVLDTSVFIAEERNRPLDVDSLPERGFVSVVSLAELQAGVLAATRTEHRATRLRTLDGVSALDLLPITADVAGHWARLRVRLAEAGRRAPVNDLWIAATAIAAGMPVVTQDTDFDAFDELGLLEVIRV